MPGTPDSPVKFVKGVGPSKEKSFNEIGIHTVRDLLFYFPAKHLDRTNILSSMQVKRYVSNGYEGELTVVAEVAETELIRYGKKQIFKLKLKDSSGYFECVWFQKVKYFRGRFNAGDIYAISGKPVISRYGNLQFAHPDFDRLESEESDQFRHTGKIIPFYTIPRKLKEKKIGELGLRNIIRAAVETYSDTITETLPAEVIKKNNLLTLPEAIRQMHYPANKKSLETSFRRFKFEEFFFFELLVALRKHNIKDEREGISFGFGSARIREFLKKLPFELTAAQLKVMSEIRRDMESPKPMNRLLQGDVGSGKTVVALIAMLTAVENGWQAAIAAPTEILAQQHYLKINEMLKGTGIGITLLTGGQGKKQRREVLEEISGEAGIIVGTHALFEENVEFAKLGLIVIDEQHRFGVAQRAGLIAKSTAPDVLVMTATPIPRTLTMTLYGDLDVSVIDEMPASRKPVKTILRGEHKLPDIYKFIADKKKEGYRAYIVYPLVEESDKSDLKSAEEYYEKLTGSYLQDLNVGLLHGKMKAEDKNEIMRKFAAGELDVLVATTVIEVGIDVPESNIIVINDAHRFGLSQLHQLRGRVGRGSEQAYCVLVTKDEIIARRTPVSLEYLSAASIEKSKSKIRLKAMVEHTSGFELSEIDLKLRGPGDIFGTKQSGLPELKFAELGVDNQILTEAKEEAFGLIAEDPRLNKKENRSTKVKLVTVYAENLFYAGIA